MENLVESLADKYESPLKNSWRPDYDASLLSAIVGIEIAISEVQCKYKLSQNRPQADRLQVIQQLEARGSGDLAAAMEKQEP